MAYQLMLINPGGSRFPPVKAWKAPWLRSIEDVSHPDVWLTRHSGIQALTGMVLVATGTGICDGSNGNVPHTIVALSSARVGDLDFTTAEWARRLVVLPEVRKGNDLGSVLSTIMDFSLAYNQLKS